MTTFSPTSTGKNGTIQTWVVFSSGPHSIQAIGAKGGPNNTLQGGLGASIYGEFVLTAGHTIQILVGQDGTYSGAGAAGGGGGGTFVYNQTTATLLIAAGAGGGVSGSVSPASGVNASTTITSSPPPGTSYTSTNGAGGGTGSSTQGGSGGAGWLGDGLSSSQSQGGYRFLAPTYPGQGGYLGICGSGGDGGFGGGGGGEWCYQGSSGGGGGYSGGSSGGNVSYHAGGGGSFNGGTNQTGIITSSSSSVEIVNLNPPPTAPTLVAPADLSEVSASDPLLYDWVFNDPNAGQMQSEFALVRRKVAP
jgi:hypothetical protein